MPAGRWGRMTERGAVSLADYVESLGVLFLWLVIVIRAVPALRQPNQRTMWTAVLLGACAMSLRIAPLYGLATRLTGQDLLGTSREIVADVIGLFAAAGIFAFVLNVVGKGKYARLTYGIALVVAAVLLLIDRYYDARTSTGLSQHSTAGTVYWLILLLYHLVANVWCADICWRCAARTRAASLKAALLIFGGATTMAALLMFLSLIHFFTRSTAVAHLFPFVQGVEAFLYGLGAAVPLAKPFARAYRQTTLLSQLYPLWRDLANNVDGITLHKPRSYPAYLVLSGVGPSHGLYRRVIEVHDGILVLNRHVRPAERLAAARFVHAQGIDRDDVEPASTACCIAIALQHRSAGQTALAEHAQQTQRDANLYAEAAHLARIAFFHRSPLPGEFTRREHRRAAPDHEQPPDQARVKSSKSKPGQTTQLTRTS